MKKLIALFSLFLAAPLRAQIAPVQSSNGSVYSGNLANVSALNVSTIYTLDLSSFQSSRISAEVTAGTATIAAATFNDGSQSTGTITISHDGTGTPVGLSSATATDRVTIISTGSLVGSVLTVAGYPITGVKNGATGLQFNVTNNTTSTAISLAQAIARIPGLITSNSASVVYTTAAYGSFYNSYSMTSNNSNMTVATPYLQGGADNAVVTIDGVSLTQGQQWYISTSSSLAAASLARAIAANTTLNAVISVSSNTGGAGAGIVNLTSLLNGSAYNYTIASSTPTALAVAGMSFGVNPAFALAGSVFTASSNEGLTLGLPVSISSITAIGGASPITSLGTNVSGQTYYAIPLDADTFELGLYSTGAVVSPPLNLLVVTSTNSHTQNSVDTYTITPLISSGTAAYIFQASDDGANWVTAPLSPTLSTNTVTVWNTVGLASCSHTTVDCATTTAQTSNLVDFGFFNYRYLRLNVTAPLQGGLFLQAPVVIKQDGIGKF